MNSMRIPIFCDTHEEYSAILSLTGQAPCSLLTGERVEPVPFLGSPQASSKLESLLRSQASSTNAREFIDTLCEGAFAASGERPLPSTSAQRLEDGVVLALSESCDAPARLYAQLAERRYVPSSSRATLPALLESSGAPRSLLVIGLPDDFSPTLMRQLAEASVRIPLGVLSGRTPRLLSQVVAWQAIAAKAPSVRGKHVIVADDGDFEEFADSPFTTCTDGATGAELTELLSADDVELLAFMGHGSAIDVHIGSSSILCGRRASPGARTVSLAHACQLDNVCQRDPGGMRTKIPIDAVSARVIYANTCAGISIGDQLHSPDLNLSIGAIESGALAYISVVRASRASSLHLMVMSSALRSGYSIGACVVEVNRVHVMMFNEPPAHLLFGDPEVGSAGGNTGFAPRHTALEVESDGTVYADFCGQAYFAGSVANGSIGHDVPVCAVLNERHDQAASRMPRVASFAHGDGLYIVCCSPELTDVRIRLRLKPQISSDHDSARAYIRRVSRNIASTQLLATHLFAKSPTKTRFGGHRFAEDLREACDGAFRLRSGLVDALFSTPSHKESNGDELNLYRQRLVELERDLLGRHGNWDLFWYPPDMFSNLYATESCLREREQCATCEAPMDVLRAVSTFGLENVRLTAYCQRCLLAYDRVGSGPQVSIRVPMTIRAGLSFVATMRLTNPHAAPLEVSLILYSFEGLSGPGIRSEISTPLAISLLPHESRTVSWPLYVIREASAGVHRVICMYVCEMDISFAYSSTFVESADIGDRRTIPISFAGQVGQQ
jgi:hypothetical protein